MSNVISIKTKRRALAANRMAYDSRLISGEVGDLLERLSNMMASFDADIEKCAMQNIKASRSVLLFKTEGNA